MKITVMRIFALVLSLAAITSFAFAGGGSEQNAIPPETLNALRRSGLQFMQSRVQPVDFTLSALDGSNVTLSDLKGKVVFLNFWATWCGPCEAEMPSMESLYQKLKDKGFVILAMNLRETNAQVSDFMKKYKLSFTALLDRTGRIGSLYGVQAIPTSYIIDRNGFIVARMIGSINWNTPDIIAAMETLLK